MHAVIRAYSNIPRTRTHTFSSKYIYISRAHVNFQTERYEQVKFTIIYTLYNDTHLYAPKYAYIVLFITHVFMHNAISYAHTFYFLYIARRLLITQRQLNLRPPPPSVIGGAALHTSVWASMKKVQTNIFCTRSHTSHFRTYPCAWASDAAPHTSIWASMKKVQKRAFMSNTFFVHAYTRHTFAHTHAFATY